MSNPFVFRNPLGCANTAATFDLNSWCPITGRACFSPTKIVRVVNEILSWASSTGNRLRAGFTSAIIALILFSIPPCAGAGQVTLAWNTPSQSTDGYKIFQREQGKSFDYTHPVWPADGKDHAETTCTISNLTEGITYCFVVRAYAGDIESGNSNEVTFKPEQSTGNDNNQPPVAEAGTNKTVTAGQTVTLNGSGSSDPDGNALSYKWTQTRGPGVVLSAATEAQCTFTAPDPGTQSTTLVFELTATDGGALSASDTCLVMVQPSRQLTDTDGDGMPDDQDLDDDNDGMPDDWEAQFNLDPLKNNADEDADNDGLSNLQEYQAGSDPGHCEGNQVPQQPTLISPAYGDSTSGLTPRIAADAFSDPDKNDTHSKTQWRISLATDTQQVVMDRIYVNKNLTEVEVPHLILDPNTRYAAQVRFFDSHGESSPWSEPVVFDTPEDFEDLNQNKIPDIQEVAEDTDMNADAIPDVQQQNVIKTLSTYNARNVVSVSVEDSETAIAVEAAQSIDPGTLEPASVSDDQTPYGLLGSKIRVDQPGDGTYARIYLSDAVDPHRTRWARYDDADSGMQDCAETAIISDDGLTVDRYLVDGGDEDADGTANGVIVDVSGPQASVSSDGSGLTSDGQSASGGSSGGCFIGSMF